MTQLLNMFHQLFSESKPSQAKPSLLVIMILTAPIAECNLKITVIQKATFGWLFLCPKGIGSAGD